MTFPVLCAIVALTNACGTVSVDLHGARVVSYVPVGGEEVFFSSETGTGGVPLCWPWFGGLGPAADSRRHGVARYGDFKLVETKNHSYCDKELVLRLDSNDETRRHFPHDFALTVCVRLSDRLTIKMTGENTGSDPFEVTEAFHPYLAVADSQTCRVEGESSSECRLVDAAGGNVFSFSDEGGAGRRVWRPNAESHLSKTVSAIAPDDWRKFICVEYGTFDRKRAYTLKPGETHSLVSTVNLSLTHGNAKPVDLQAKVDAVAAAGGGRVSVPAGEWLSKGAVHLKSNVELHLEEGALLTFPDDPKACLPVVRTSFGGIEYCGLSPLVYACGQTNVAVTGKGAIAPRMAFWRGWFEREQRPEALENMRRLYAWGENDTPVEARRFEDPVVSRLRPSCVEFEGCRNVRLEGFKIRESPLWCVHIHRCEDVVVRGVDIRARGHNNDGIDVNASRNVLVEDCVLDQGDDGFVIKSGRDRDGRRVGVPCENVEIRNCLIKGGHTLLAVGSEISGGIRNISLHDCRVEGNLSVLAIVKTSDRKGAFVENVSVSNVVVRGNVGKVVAVATNVDYQWGKFPARERIVTRIDGFRVENVEADSAKMVYSLMGDKRLPAKNVVLKDVRVQKCEGESRAENVGFTVLP